MAERLSVWLLAAILAGLSIQPAQQDGPGAGDTERGAYLAWIAGCATCHSPTDGPAFSGTLLTLNGQPIAAPNLTPDVTGLGGWTAGQIRMAIATGIRPDGRQLHPVMPYVYYNRMADADLDDLVAYLQSLEPVQAELAAPPDLTGVALPEPPALRSGVQVPDAADSVAYGGYLVDAVMACGSCHTPTLPDGSPDPERYLAGGTAFSGEWGTVYASNLTPQMTGGLGSRRDEAIILAIVDGQHPDRRPLYAMPWPAYSHLTGRDVEAVVAYLRSLEPVFNEVPPADLREGYQYYERAPSGPPAPVNVAFTLLMGLLFVALVIYVSVRQYRHAQRMRTTDWEAHFRDVLLEARQQPSLDEPEDGGSPTQPT